MLNGTRRIIERKRRPVATDRTTQLAALFGAVYPKPGLLFGTYESGNK